jgi:hypothetical protein
VGDVHELPLLGRELFIHEDGAAFRATWHLNQGLVNLTVWRDDRCTEAFQLSVEEASRLVTYLVGGLATAAQSAIDATPAVAPARRSIGFVDRLRSALRQLTA